MKILLVAATKAEIEPFLTYFSFRDVLPYDKSFGNYQIKVLITGVGMVATAFYVSKALSEHRFDLLINVGIAGSFNPELKEGDVCRVKEDVFAELGAEDGENFIRIDQLGLGRSSYFPNPNLLFPHANNLKSVKAITVNKVHGNEDSIAKAVKLFNPDIESMEGAACFYACEQSKTPCIQIRSISNRVERRNRDNWQIGVAIKTLNETLIGFFES